MSDARPLVEFAAAMAEDKKADDIKVIDLEGISLIADHMLLCSGQTSVKVRAIAQHIDSELTKAGHTLYGTEGMSDGLWVLMDFGELIVHVMRQEEREFYNLERLWGQGRMRDWNPAPASNP